MNSPLSISSALAYDVPITRTVEGIANSPSFISRLPNDILEAIFICGACDYHAEYSGLPIPTPPSWVNVSYVCRHWRNVALNRPTLWTHLFITSPRWTEELLSRSEQAPLRLHVNTNYCQWSNDWVAGYLALRFLDQVGNHLERIEELRLHLPVVHEDDQVFSKLLARAPRLKTLKISTYTIPAEWEWPSVLFHGDTPALRSLDLLFCPLSWRSFKLSGLTTLSLRHIPVQFHQSIVEFLATLRCMRDLRHLYLDKALLSAAGFLSSAAFHSFPKIDLPLLSRLWISAPLSTVITLLSCVTVPLKTEIRLECALEHGPLLDDHTLLSSLLAQRLNTSEDPAQCTPEIRSLVMKFYGHMHMVTLTLNASERAHDFSSIPHVDWGRNVPLQVAIDFGELVVAGGRDHMMSNICCSIPLTKVQSLHVVFPPSSPAFWRKTLGYLRDLRYLKLSKGCTPDLASILSFTPHWHRQTAENQYTERSPNQVLAPRLEDLELHDITLLTSRRNTNTASANLRLLYNALSSRRNSHGHLRMVQCRVDGYDQSIELDMVGQWDGGHFHVVEELRRPYEEPPRFDFSPDYESLEV